MVVCGIASCLLFASFVVVFWVLCGLQLIALWLVVCILVGFGWFSFGVCGGFDYAVICYCRWFAFCYLLVVRLVWVFRLLLVVYMVV